MRRACGQSLNRQPELEKRRWEIPHRPFQSGVRPAGSELSTYRWFSSLLSAKVEKRVPVGALSTAPRRFLGAQIKKDMRAAVRIANEQDDPDTSDLFAETVQI